LLLLLFLQPLHLFLQLLVTPCLLPHPSRPRKLLVLVADAWAARLLGTQQQGPLLLQAAAAVRPA
jgi:hypothetical protein